MSYGMAHDNGHARFQVDTGSNSGFVKKNFQDFQVQERVIDRPAHE